MKKNFYFKLFTIAALFIFSTIAALAQTADLTFIKKISIEPLQNNTYTMNLYFDKTFTGKAFIHKVDTGFYSIFLPNTEVNLRKLTVNYKSKYDKNNINFEIEQKPFINKDDESSYVKINVNMKNDYSLKLMSKNIADDKFGLSSFSSVNTYSFILIILGLVIFFMFRKLLNMAKAGKRQNSYTAFPDSFKVHNFKQNEKLTFEKNLQNIRLKHIPNIGLSYKNSTADAKSFSCFEINKNKDEKMNTYEFKSAIKESSAILTKTKQTNPIKKQQSFENSELDLPLAEKPLQEEEQNGNNKAELISVLNITPGKGFYLTNLEDTMALFGFIGENVFLLKKFNDLSQINLQARYYDKNGDNDVYIVRLDSYKAMVEISDKAMKELVVL